MTNIFRRLKNLWQLSRFKITEFDNKLVITKKDDGELVVAFPEQPRKMAQIIKRKPTLDEVIERTINNG